MSHYFRLERLTKDNPFSLWGLICRLRRKWSVVILGVYLNTSQFKNVPSRLECFITVGWKGLPGTNSEAYGGSFVGYKNEVNWILEHNHNTSQFKNEPSKLERFSIVGWKGLPGTGAEAYGGSFVGNKENEVLWIRGCIDNTSSIKNGPNKLESFTTLHWKAC